MAQRQWKMEEKLEIVLLGLKGEASVAELCRRHGVTETTYYKWRSRFLETGKQGLANGKGGPSSRERQLLQENEELKTTLGELTVQNRLLKKLENLGR